MLSRIANSLFWMGRYLERVEHVARFAKVQYFSSLDAPTSLKKEQVLESLLEMTGLPIKYCKLTNEEVLFRISIDDNNAFSLLSSINMARENARGARDTISSELWETINTYYHKLNNYKNNAFDTDEFMEIADLILSNSAVIKGLIENTLFHQETRALISEGIHIERAIQVSRIILIKLNDIAKIEKSNMEDAQESYHLSTLLKSAESFDMCHRFYRKIPNKRNTLEFLILNFDFPKSIAFNLEKAEEYLKYITKTQRDIDTSPLYQLSKLTSKIRYTQLDDIIDDVYNFKHKNLMKLYEIVKSIESTYLKY